MVTQQFIDATGRRGARLAAAVALCLLVVAVPGAAAAADGSTSTASRAPGDARAGTLGGGSAAASASTGVGVAAAVPAQVDAARGQLLGVLLVLLVLAGVGVAAWGARPDGFGRLDRTSSVLALVPGSRAEEADEVRRGVTAEGERLTDEEQIIELLEENDGRLKQQRVVETTDWSKAKVSRLLSSMEDEDAIVRIQLGREKLIFLSGREPSGARPVHREEG